MSLLWYDAVTKYTTSAEAALVWDSMGTSVTMSTSLSPYGVGRSVKPNGSDSVNATITWGSTETKIRFGFWYRISSTLRNLAVGFYHTGSRMSQFYLNSGPVYFDRGFYTTRQNIGTLQTYGVVNSWRWYEGYIGFGNSTGFGHFRMNGRDIGSFTDVDTIYESTKVGATQLRFLTTFNAGEFAGFMIWNDSTAEWPNGWIGPQRFDHLQPVGDGVHSDWTLSAGSSGWSLVDGLTLSTSDYISSTSTGNESSFTLSTLPSGAAHIKGISVEAWTANVGGGSTSLAPGIIDASTQAYATAVAGDFRAYGFFPTRPGSTVEWSSTDLANTEITVRHG